MARVPIKVWLVGLVLLLGSVSQAQAAVTIANGGEGAGEVSGPEAISTDASAERLYVADRNNHRIDVFDLSGSFVMAFGWGVADGSAELQTCTSTCLPGLPGGGAGEFARLTGVAADESSHRVYAYDETEGSLNGGRVQEFESSGEFLRSWGGGVLAAATAGTATLTAGSTTLTDVATSKGAFKPGAALSGSGLAAGTRIVFVGFDDTLTISKPATGSGARTITVGEGPGNVPIGEIQEIRSDGSSGTFRLTFEPPRPPAGVQEITSSLPSNATPASIQAALEALPSIEPGEVSVSGSPGVSYQVEFKGGLGDVDLAPMGVSGSSGVSLFTVRNGHSSPEVCTAAVAESCSGGVEGAEPGAFGQVGKMAIAPGGKVVVADSQQNGPFEAEGFSSRFQAFDSTGAPLADHFLAGFETRVSGVAVDPTTGNVYVAAAAGAGIREYSPAGTCLNCAEPLLESNSNLQALAVDSGGNLYVATADLAGPVIVEFNASGEEVRAFGYGDLSRSANGLAIHHSAEGDVFATEGDSGESRVLYLSFPEPGPVVPHVLSGTFASPVRSTRATLNGFVNPEGSETSYHFEYVDEATYEADVTALGSGHGFDHAVRAPASAGEDPTLPADFDAHKVSREINGLEPETRYRYRLVAENSEGEDSFEGQPFETLGPFELLRFWTTHVQTDSARLNVKLNPLGSPASGYFEYVDDATYKADEEALGPGHGFDHAIQVPDVGGGAEALQFGEGEEPVVREVTAHNLAPGTLYHYRVKVSDAFTEATSSQKIFTTAEVPGEAPASCPNAALRNGLGRYLPDCRAYEMVSPVDKAGGEVLAIPNTHGDPTAFDRSATSGERLTYASYRAFAEPESSSWANQYLADRTPAGWVTRSISPPRGPSFYGGVFDNEYAVFSPDLCEGWLRHDAEPTLSPSAPAGFPGLYRTGLCSSPRSYETLTEATPNVEPSQFQPEIQGISENGEYTLFRARAKLTTNAVAGRFELYESHEGKLKFLCILPGGTVSGEECSAGTANESANFARRQSVVNALSADGSRIFWSAATTPSGEGKIYLRINPFGSGGECSKASAPCTIAISQAGETLSGTSSARFWMASPDGDTAIFSAGADPYRFEVASKTTTLIAHESKGVLGASADTSHVYFASEEANSAEQAEGATPGKPNLYLWVAGSGSSFIGTLSPEDLRPELRKIAITPDPLKRTAAVSADGLHATFTSAAPLTGYDNTDSNSGEPAVEVFIYDATAAPGARLHCVSCDPSGGSPEGRRETGINEATSWVAATLPTWQNQLYLPRYLAEDGSRLFFNSTQALVPRDSNGMQDVYEWQAASSKAECEEKQAGLYVAGAGGCLALISGGAGSSDSEFLDADPGGSNAFFATRESLVPQDYGATDIYDARIDGGFPPPPPAPPGCEGEACQAGSSPPPSSSPASSTYQGAGNVPPKHKHHRKHKKRKHHKKRRHKGQGRAHR